MSQYDARKVTDRFAEVIHVTNELLRDEDGNLWLVNDEYLKEQIKQREASVEREMELRLAKELLESTLPRLPKRQQDVIYYTMRRFSQRRIADILGISVASVKKSLQAARKKLASHIQKNKRILKEGLNNGNSTTNKTNLGS